MSECPEQYLSETPLNQRIEYLRSCSKAVGKANFRLIGPCFSCRHGVSETIDDISHRDDAYRKSIKQATLFYDEFHRHVRVSDPANDRARRGVRAGLHRLDGNIGSGLRDHEVLNPEGRHVEAVRRPRRRFEMKRGRFAFFQHDDGRFERKGLTVRFNVNNFCKSGRRGCNDAQPKKSGRKCFDHIRPFKIKFRSSLTRAA